MNRHLLPTSTAMLLCFSASAFAQFRCDCTSVVDSCEADIAIRGNSIEITTDHMQCARVDYFVDGQPFVSLVVDGEGSERWTAPTQSPRVLVQSCQVCRENPGAARSPNAAPSAPAGDAGSDDGRLEALIQVQPEYPPDALARGVAGRVDVELGINPQGIVQTASVVAAEPSGVFDAAALSAVRRWRYPADPGTELRTVVEGIEFRPSAVAAATLLPPPAAAAERVVRNGPRNQCVREGARFNYGDMVEVTLINACETPIMVYACAEGTGGDRGRWACITSEQQRSVLVQPSHAQAGETGTIDDDAGAGAGLEVSFTDRMILSRAPNTEYWWLACAIEDQSCRDAGSQWVRSLERQHASADPQGRSSSSLGRSF